MAPYKAIQGPNEFCYTGSIKDWNRVPDLHTITQPALVLCGLHDELTPACSRLIHQGLANAAITVFPNSSHMPFWEEPDAVLRGARRVSRRQRRLGAAHGTLPLPPAAPAGIATGADRCQPRQFSAGAVDPGRPGPHPARHQGDPFGDRRHPSPLRPGSAGAVQYFYFVRNALHGRIRQIHRVQGRGHGADRRPPRADHLPASLHRGAGPGAHHPGRRDLRAEGGSLARSADPPFLHARPRPAAVLARHRAHPPVQPEARAVSRSPATARASSTTCTTSSSVRSPWPSLWRRC